METTLIPKTHCYVLWNNLPVFFNRCIVLLEVTTRRLVHLVINWGRQVSCCISVIFYWYQGSQCIPRNYPLYHYTHQPEPLIMQDEPFMLFMLNSGSTIQMSQQRLRLMKPGSNFQYFIVQFLWSLMNCSLRFLFLFDRSSTWHALRFDVLYIQGCYFVYFHCKVWLSELLLSFYQLGPVLVWLILSRDFCLQNCHSLDFFLFLALMTVVHKFPYRLAIFEILTSI